jgi:predicted Zn finger-like uncharacterized protein
MIVTCPSCSVRYVVDPRALSARGRTVRCARCTHTWHQAPPAEPLPPVDAPPSPAPVIETPAPQPSPRERVAPTVSQTDRVQLPAVTRPRRAWRAALAWAAVVVVFAGLGYGAIAGRGRVVEILPQAARFYTLAGFPVETPSLGLELRKVTPSRDMRNGVATLVIDGEVLNISTVARAVPKLKVILRDHGDHDLQDWTFSVTDDRLKPGESVPFHTSVPQPTAGATDVVVTFAGGG